MKKNYYALLVAIFANKTATESLIYMGLKSTEEEE